MMVGVRLRWRYRRRDHFDGEARRLTLDHRRQDRRRLALEHDAFRAGAQGLTGALHIAPSAEEENFDLRRDFLVAPDRFHHIRFRFQIDHDTIRAFLLNEPAGVDASVRLTHEHDVCVAFE